MSWLSAEKAKKAGKGETAGYYRKNGTVVTSAQARTITKANKEKRAAAAGTKEQPGNTSNQGKPKTQTTKPQTARTNRGTGGGIQLTPKKGTKKLAPGVGKRGTQPKKGTKA